MAYELHEESPRILVVDDERIIREILSDFLTMEGFVVRTVGDGPAALEELRKRTYDLLISDLRMPEMSGLELLERNNALNLNVLTVIMTGFGTVETAIEAMKKGAYDYILKPFKVEEVVHIVRRGLERRRLQQENMRLKEALSIYRVSAAVSQSLSLDHVLELIVNVTCEETAADMVTLMLGETGEPAKFSEHVRGGPNVDKQLLGVLNVGEMLRYHNDDHPLLAHGAKTNRFLTPGSSANRVSSFCSVPLRGRRGVTGMLNAFSFTRGHKFTEGQRKMLAILAGRAAISIENARLYEGLLRSSGKLEVANRQLEENFRQTIVGFANALEESDRYTRGHSERVALYAHAIADGMELDTELVDTIVLAAQVHDIGKIGIPTEELNKADKLTEQEIATLHTHPDKGKRILEPVPFLRKLVPGAYCHHEAFDGSGYPRGLAGKEIPLIGRIIAVADAYDAMTTDRSYRRALSTEAAIAELKRCSGSQFDPDIVDVFLLILRDNRREAELNRQRIQISALTP